MSDTLGTVDRRIQIHFKKSISNTFLMTDGISDVYFETDSKLDDIDCWNTLINDIDTNVNFEGGAIRSEFQEWINFFSRGNHDDRTIIWIK